MVRKSKNNPVNNPNTQIAQALPKKLGLEQRVKELAPERLIDEEDGFKYIHLKWLKEIIPLAKEGLTLVKIGEEVGLVKERVRQIINQSGNYDAYRNARRIRKNKDKPDPELDPNRKEFLFLLEERIEQLAKIEGPGWEAAVQYYRKLGRINSNFLEIVAKALTHYFSARESGKKLSLAELGRGTTLEKGSYLGKILASFGLEPFYGTRDRNPIPLWKKEAIHRSNNTILSPKDIGYFLNVPSKLVISRFSKLNNSWSRSNRYIYGEKGLTFRLASQVYEAIDVGFSPSETLELIESASSKTINCALDQRESIEPQIISALRVIYNDEDISQPYISRR